MGVQDEWLKGLEGEGVAHKLDVLRVERFEKFKGGRKNLRSAGAGDALEPSNETLGLQSGQHDLPQHVQGGNARQLGNTPEPHQYQDEFGVLQGTSADPFNEAAFRAETIDSGQKFVVPHPIFEDHDGFRDCMLDFLDRARPLYFLSAVNFFIPEPIFSHQIDM